MAENGGGRVLPRPDVTGTVAVFDGIRVAWEWLCADPHPVTVPGTEIIGLPDRPVPLGELRLQVLDPATPGPVRDAVWAHLVTRSRRDGPTWTVACAGMALPMLGGAYRDCASRARRYAGDRAAALTFPGVADRASSARRSGRSGGRAGDRAGCEDIASEVVTGFVAALATVDTDRPGIASALRWAALRAGLGAMRENLDAPTPRPHDKLIAAALTSPHGSGTGGITGASSDSEQRSPDTTTETAETAETTGGRGWGSAPPPARSAHPDLVLADAVADGVITAAEADLIGETRLQGATLHTVADRTRRTVGAVTMGRLRAELRLIDHLLGPDLTATHTTTDVTAAHAPPDIGGDPDVAAAPPGEATEPAAAPGDSVTSPTPTGPTPTGPAPSVGSRSVPCAVSRRSSHSVSTPAAPSTPRGGPGRRGAGEGGAAPGSPSVSGRRRRRTRGARRAQTEQVTR